MKTAIPIRVGFLHMLLLCALSGIAQVAPYALPPKWMFGYQGGLDFTGGAPVVLTGNPTTAATAVALENSAVVCEPSKNLAFYTNTKIVYNGATNGTVRNLFTADGIASNSATGGGVAIPDPSAPATKFYLFLANDLSGGDAPGSGIVYYKLTKSGTTVTITSGPTVLAGTAGTGAGAVDESIGACSDGDGGYWIASHEKANNNFWVWHVTTTGVSAVDKQTHTPYVGGEAQGTLKFNRCQNKIAWTGNNSLVVYNWDRTTGKIDNSAPIYSNVLGMGATNTEPTYGLEFSPDGTKIYHTVLGRDAAVAGVIRQVNLTTGVLAVVDNTGSPNGGSKEVGTMQLGPDNKIYVTEGANGSNNACYIGVIGTPNNTIAGGVGYSRTGFTLKPANASNDPSTYRGIVNLAWMSPNDPVLNNTLVTSGSGCSMDFDFNFQTYFLEDIAVTNSSIKWDFNYNGTTPAYETAYNGNATPQFDYGTLATGSHSYTVLLTFKDQVCSQDWKITKTISTTCSLPVEWETFSARSIAGGNEIHWGTYSETNNNYFTVQRSYDGSAFTDLGRVNAVGNSLTVQQYQYIDREYSAEDVVYYRIVQVDIDGKYSYSKTITLSNQKASLKVYPNPSEGLFDIELSGAADAQINITDVLGRVVYSTTSSADYVHARLGEEFNKGTYILTVITSGGILREKLVKE